MRSKHKAQVRKNGPPAPAETIRFIRLKGIFLPRYGTLSSSGQPGRVSWLVEGGGEDTASRAASWNDPRIQLFFFLLSPRCLEKHKDFDIWAEQRGGNETMTHSGFPLLSFYPLQKAQEELLFTFSHRCK